LHLGNRSGRRPRGPGAICKLAPCEFGVRGSCRPRLARRKAGGLACWHSPESRPFCQPNWTICNSGLDKSTSAGSYVRTQGTRAHNKRTGTPKSIQRLPVLRRLARKFPGCSFPKCFVGCRRRETQSPERMASTHVRKRQGGTAHLQNLSELGEAFPEVAAGTLPLWDYPRRAYVLRLTISLASATDFRNCLASDFIFGAGGSSAWLFGVA